MDCLFCKIIRKDIGSHVLYEDEQTVAVLDAFPRAPGHTLILPKQHCETVLEASDAQMTALALTVKRLTGILQSALQPTGFTIGINHGKHAGQSIDHLHIHILPRFQEDGGGSIHSVVDNPGNQSIEHVAQKIRSNIK